MKPAGAWRSALNIAPRRLRIGVEAGLLLVVFARLMAGAAMADAPPLAPGSRICSAGRHVCASGDAATRRTSIWKRAAGAGRPIWSIAGLHSDLLLADDGSSVVTFPAGFLLGAAPQPSETALMFHRPGRAPVSYTLGQLVAAPAKLPRSVSHRLWLRSADYTASGLFAVETVEGRRYLFDPRTGLIRR